MQTYKRKQKFWQILFPFLVSMILIFFAGYMLFDNTRTGNSSLRIWSDISIIFILLPVIVFVVIKFLLIILFIGVVHQLRKIFDQKIDKIRTPIINVSAMLKNGAELLNQPIIALESLSAIFGRKEE